MGLLRFILSASVVVAHSSQIPGISLLDAGLAVKTFFVISGFYMQLILDSKYGRVPDGIRLFYTNRALRIYPMYLLTFAFAVLFYLAASIKLGHPADRLHFWVSAFQRHEFLPLALIAVSQFTIFGLDITPLFSFSPTVGFHLWDAVLPADADRAWRFNFMPHCWSIGAELLFYLVMPLFNFCRTRVLIVLCFLGAATVPLTYALCPGVAGAATYHLGALQFYYFLLGIIGYRLVYKKVLSARTRRDWRLYLPVVPVALLSFSPWWNSPSVSAPTHALLYAFYLGLAALAVPFLFHLTRQASWDRWIGELSYPMYLLHIPLKWVLLAMVGVSQKDEAIVSGTSLLLVTVVVALAMTYFVDRPIESFRQRRFEREARA